MRHDKKLPLILRPCVLGSLLCMLHTVASAIDSVSIEATNGDETSVVRIAAQWNWPDQFLKKDDSFVGAYWDLSVADWHSTDYMDIKGNVQNMTDIGITPVFRLQAPDSQGTYGEVAVGAHYLSQLYDNDGKRLSTKFEFGDSIGLGYRFTSNWDLSLKLQHFSNAGIKHPNDGVLFYGVRLIKHF